MAKVKGPLFSLGATGKLADALVYMTWKGIADVRQYVIPANPKTALQSLQRGYMIDAVDMWHFNPWNAADLTAFNGWAALSASAMSGFNRVIKEYLTARIAAGAWHPVHSLVISGVIATGFDIACTGEAAVAYTCNYGTSPTAMVNVNVVANVAGALTTTLALLSTKTDYYFEIIPTTPGEYGRMGICKQKTS